MTHGGGGGGGRFTPHSRLGSGAGHGEGLWSLQDKPGPGAPSSACQVRVPGEPYSAIALPASKRTARLAAAEATSANPTSRSRASVSREPTSGLVPASA